MGYGGAYRVHLEAVVLLHYRGLPPRAIRTALERRAASEPARAGAPAALDALPSPATIRYMLHSEGHLAARERVSRRERERRYRELGEAAVALRVDGASWSAVRETLGLTDYELQQARRAQRDAERARTDPIAALTPQTRKTLRRRGITTLEQLAAQSEPALLRIPAFGPKRLEEVRSLLSAHGRRFAA